MDVPIKNYNIPKDLIAIWLNKQPGKDIHEKVTKVIEKAYIDYHLALARDAYYHAYHISKTYTEKCEYLELAVMSYNAVGYNIIVEKLQRQIQYIVDHHLRSDKK